MCHNSGVWYSKRIVITQPCWKAWQQHYGKWETLSVKSAQWQTWLVRKSVYNLSHCADDYFMPPDLHPATVHYMCPPEPGYSTNTSISTSGFIYFPTSPYHLVFPNAGSRYYYPHTCLSQNCRSSSQLLPCLLLSFPWTPNKLAFNHEHVLSFHYKYPSNKTLIHPIDPY